MERNIKIKNDCSLMTPDEIVDLILDSRGVTIDKDRFLDPQEEELLSPLTIPYIDKAAEIVLNGMMENKTFFINVDSDTDGVMSGTIMYKWLKGNGFDPGWYISQGKTHGTSSNLIGELAKEHYDILIIVDSLDNDIENYQKIKALGTEIVVLDHHDIVSTIPYDDWITLVSSNRSDNKELSGSGVVWKFCGYLDEKLGTFDAEDLIPYAAIGLIADMVDVSQDSMENRYIANKAFNCYREDPKKYPAIRRVLGNYVLDAQSVAFSIAPLVNATCRYNKNKLAFQMFITDDEQEMTDLYKELKKCRNIQNTEIDEIMDDILDQCEQQKDKSVLFIVVNTESGISGLVANKILNQYGKPTFVVKEGDTGYSGSSRAMGVGDFRQLCEDTNLCMARGHPEAFGFVCSYDNIDEFLETINEIVEEQGTILDIDVDAEIEIDDVTSELINSIHILDRITGSGFKQILFKITADHFKVRSLTEGKHWVCETDDFLFIKWNAGNELEKMEEYAETEQSISFFGKLEAGFIGRNYSCRLIVSDYIVEG